MGNFRLGAKSEEKLNGCHPVLAQIVRAAMDVSPMDFTVLVGWRGKADQDAAVAAGKSKTPWPTSKHNQMNNGRPESMAVDFAPWPIDWNDIKAFHFLAGFIMGVGAPIAAAHGYRLRYGGNFNDDGNFTNDHFVDGDHLELVKI